MRPHAPISYSDIYFMSRAIDTGADGGLTGFCHFPPETEGYSSE